MGVTTEEEGAVNEGEDEEEDPSEEEEGSISESEDDGALSEVEEDGVEDEEEGWSSSAEDSCEAESAGSAHDGDTNKMWLEAAETDTSDEEEVRNTVGNIPLEWYDELPHIGYDIEGKQVTKHSSGGDEAS